MKSKLFLLFPMLLSPILLSSCQGFSAKIDLQYGQMIHDDVDYIDYQTLKEKIDSKETFIVSVYAKNCSCWSMLHTNLIDYISKNHIQVFAVNYDNFHDASGKTLDNFNLNIQSGYTSFAIFDKGELKVNLKSGDDDLFKNTTGFERFMEEKVNLPKMFYVSLSEVDQLYATNKKSVIYFARSTCSDCQYFDTNFLSNYKANNNLYILDCETIGIRDYEENGSLTPESAVKWQEFKDNYGLSETINTTYGYGTGYVPTLLFVQGNEVTKKPTFLAGSVYFNDSVSQINDEYVITSSYYTAERNALQPYLDENDEVLLNKKVSEDFVIKNGDYLFLDKSKMATYHDKLVKKFLDYSLPLVDSDVTFTK
ncbi:MAG: hypothetical protein SO206_01835 [Bacilli bacterium]|nr:hypothetical protein [Bacilli bacterium]